ncbi:MAG: adenylate/guanylate cyclase domain-containing protein [Pseudomonadota bacterium]
MSLSLVRKVRGRSDELQKLTDFWNRSVQAEAPPSQKVHEALAARFLSLAEPLLAYDVTQAAREHWPRDIKLRQQQALALSRAGDLNTARRLLEDIAADGYQDEETLGILGGVYKSLAQRERRGRARWLRRSRESYEQAHRGASGGVPLYSAINSAATALLGGDTRAAGRWARLATRLCEQQLAEDAAAQRPADYWALASLAESLLIRGKHRQALHCYGEAAAAAPGEYAQHLATRRQAVLLARHLKLDADGFAAAFPMPRIVVFAGHMVDHPTRRAAPRFPPELVENVRIAIRERLREMGPVIGYASGANGADLLFLDEVHRAGGQTYVVLPYDPHGFRERSVAGFPGANWEWLYRRALGRATDVITVAPNQLLEGGTSYLYATQVLRGLAQAHAERTDAELHGLAVFDGKVGDGAGGTASILNVWSRLARPTRERASPVMDLHIIDVDALRTGKRPRWHGETAPRIRVRNAATSKDTGDRMQIRSMMFGDVKGFGGLKEEYMPLFVDEFLGLVARVHEKTRKSRRAIVLNTWGDGLYLVFERVRDAGLFALDLNEQVVGTNWVKLGFPHQLQLRLGMHTGPVYPCMEPVTQTMTCTGTHVSRAARIEPITPPAQVYASREFAAMAQVEGVTEFSCNYVGKVVLPKKSGVIQTFRLERM